MDEEGCHEEFMLPHPEDDVAVLNDENNTADHEDHTDLLESVELRSSITGIEFGTHDCKGYHDPQVQGFAGTLKDGVDSEADIVESDLEPIEPEEGEEADVRLYSYNKSA